MALEGIAGNESNVALLGKLLDANYIQQKANAQNMAQWMVPGANKVGVSKDFYNQLRSCLAQKDYDGIKKIDVNLERKNQPIDYEEVMRDMRESKFENQFLIQSLKTSYDLMNMSITGRTQ